MEVLLPNRLVLLGCVRGCGKREFDHSVAMIQYDLAEDIDLRFGQRSREAQTSVLTHEILHIPHSLTILTIARR